ncbi:MAG TPA: cation:proton antiporter [Tepidisphaeraceae bacterium]|nr:cation:proton antiporter [Tepidisphaeraceae bacterium]
MNAREYLLVSVSAIIVLGVAAQWLAWRMKWPAILILLAFGLLAGPISQMTAGRKLLDPDVIFGELIYPIVSLSVAVVLFEGSLTLNIAELRDVGASVRNLVTIGALITWSITTLAAGLILQMPWRLSVLLGAILSVTGPTVIGPLLRQIQPTGRVGPTLKWEGIVIDPLGAVLALLVFEAIELKSGLGHLAIDATFSLLKTVLVGGVIGLAAAGILVLLLRRFWLADHLQNPVSLVMVIAAFVGADLLQDEAGLLAVTVMGIALANQKIAPYRHILEFKEALSVLLVSSLFIVMGSRLQPSQFSGLGWRAGFFVAVMIVIARPLSVLLSTMGTGLNWREKLFLSFMAPRGVVAAAVSSIFALRLARAGFEGADRLVPMTFIVIIATVTLYGLTSPLLAQRLGLAKSGAAGFLIAGAHPVARMIARELQDQGEIVAIVDTNRANLAQARLEGLTTYPMSILSEELVEKIEGTGVHQLLAMTPNEEVNSLAAVHFARVFGRSNVYQLEPEPQEPKTKEKSRVSHELHGRVLFARGITYESLRNRAADGASLKRTGLTEEFKFADLLARSPSALPLFLRNELNQISVISADTPLEPKSGQTLISLMPPIPPEST